MSGSKRIGIFALGLISVADLGMVGCGGSGRTKAENVATAKGNNVARRTRIQRILAGNVRREEPEYFLCARFPKHGTGVVVVVKRASGRRSAEALLRRHHIGGRIEVATVYAYNRGLVHLAAKIKHEVPSRFGRVDVLWEIIHGSFVCPVAHIEVSHKGHHTPDLIRWAEARVNKVGADRLRWQYVPDAKEL